MLKCRFNDLIKIALIVGYYSLVATHTHLENLQAKLYCSYMTKCQKDTTIDQPSLVACYKNHESS